MSALADYIRRRIKELDINQKELADSSGLGESAISYIMKKEGEVRPEPETIRKLAKGLQTEESLLTSILGYSIQPISGVDERTSAIVQKLLRAPWVADRLDDFLKLDRREFDHLMSHLDFQLSQAAGGSENRSKPSGRRKGG